MPSAWEPSLNPSATTQQATSTTAPDWYNSFLSGLSSSGQTAATQGGVAGPSGLQTQAYNTAPTAIAAGQPTLTQATNVATTAAGGPDINQFMNPYTTGVVNEIGRLGQKNFNDILAPNAVAGAAGSGQFGSRRGMQVYGDVARDVSKNITGQQAGALQTGYQNAVTAALQEQQNKNNAATTLGNLSNTAYTQGTGGLDILSKLGAQQQTTAQAQLNYPMTALGQRADIMRGFTVPTSQSQTTTTPAAAGQMQQSPLNQIMSLIGTIGTGATQPAKNFISGLPANSTQTLLSYLMGKITAPSGGAADNGTADGGTTGATVTTADGKEAYDAVFGAGAYDRVVNYDQTQGILNGTDTVSGGGGNDTVAGGGNDTLSGGGNDTLAGDLIDNNLIG